MAMVANDAPLVESLLDIAETQFAGCDSAIFSAEEFSNCLGTGIPQGLSALEKRFESVRYVYVDRDPVDRIVSIVIHLLADSLESVLIFESIEVYASTLSLFSRAQRDFFAARDTQFIDFRDFTRGGTGPAFLRLVAGVEFQAPEVHFNSADSYLERLLAVPDGDVDRICAFFGNDEFRSIVSQRHDFADARARFVRLIRKRVEFAVT